MFSCIYDFTSSIFFWKELNQGNQVRKRFELNRQGEGFFFLIRRMDLIDSVDEGERIVNYYDRLISHEIAHPRLELLLRACCYSWYIILC